MTAKEIKAEIRDTKREMKANGVRTISFMNAGLSSEERYYNERLFKLKTELIRAEKEEKQSNPNVKNGFLDLLGLGTKTTIYHVKAARKSKGGNRISKSSWKHKGYVIYKRNDGEFEVPRMDRDSRFDSIFDAKRFIDANTGKGMVNKGMRKNPRRKSSTKLKGPSYREHLGVKIYRVPGQGYKVPQLDSQTVFSTIEEAKQYIKDVTRDYTGNPGLLEGTVSQITSFIPVKGIRKNADGSISLLVDSAKKALAPITGMLKGVGKVSILGNKGRKRR